MKYTSVLTNPEKLKNTLRTVKKSRITETTNVDRQEADLLSASIFLRVCLRSKYIGAPWDFLQGYAI